MKRQATADAIGLHERASATPTRHDPQPSAQHGSAASYSERPRSLRSQQEWFAAVVTTPQSSPAPIDAASAGQLVTPSASLSALERIEIYRSGYHARLIECLADDYPVLQHALGEDAFEALCRAYIARFPSQGPSLNPFGRHLSEFCREASLGLPAPGFAADLAALEWAIVLSIHAPTAPLLGLEELGEIPAEQWPEVRLSPNPSLRILRFDYPVNAYLQSYRDGAAPELSPARTNAIAVYRTGRSVWRMELAPALLALIEALACGETLAASLSRVEPLLADMPEQEAVRLVMGWFRQGVSSGLFSAATVGRGA